MTKCCGKSSSSSSSSCSSSSSSSGCTISCSDSCSSTVRCRRWSQSCSEPSTGCHPVKFNCVYADAVVNIHSEIVLTTVGVTGATAGFPHTDLFINGSGFFIKKHYIVCPASLVVIPPTILGTYNRYPFVTATTPVPTGSYPNAITKVSRILVDVNNVNGCGRSFTYEAQLVGVDPAGDIALLYLNRCLPWNFCLPKLKCDRHPYFCWGSSRDARVGEKVYGLGDVFSNRNTFATAGNSLFVEGVLASNRYADYSGWALPELVAVDFEVFGQRTGIPILDTHAKVIGMQTFAVNGIRPTGLTGVTGAFTVSTGIVAGPSERFMRRVVKSFVCSAQCGADSFSNVNVDAAGSYYSYNKAWAGIAYEIVTGLDYNTTINATTGARQVVLGATGLTDGPSCKELVGIRVLTLAGNTAVTYTAVPGAGSSAPLPTTLVNSPFLGIISPGDIITYVRNNPLGDTCKDIVPAVFTWRLKVGHNACFTYRKQSENFEISYPISLPLLSFPGLFDYPYYVIQNFPLLTGFSYATYLPVTNFHPNF